MNKNPLFSATPASGTGFLHAAFSSRRLTAISSLFIVSLSLCHAAQSVTLAWDPSSDPNIAGYKLRYGPTSGNPSETIDVGKTTTATVPNLNDGTTYYFTVTAYDTAGFESQPSNQVTHTTAPDVRTNVLTVTGGNGGGNYAVGAQVTVSANAPPAGQRFAAWTEDYQVLADPSNPTTRVTMPSVDVRIMATYSSETPAD